MGNIYNLPNACVSAAAEKRILLYCGFSCRDAAIQEQEQRSYSNAADFLKEGIQLFKGWGS